VFAICVILFSLFFFFFFWWFPLMFSKFPRNVLNLFERKLNAYKVNQMWFVTCLKVIKECLNVWYLLMLVNSWFLKKLLGTNLIIFVKWKSHWF
jgi:hypothetical protein